MCDTREGRPSEPVNGCSLCCRSQKFLVQKYRRRDGKRVPQKGWEESGGLKERDPSVRLRPKALARRPLIPKQKEPSVTFAGYRR